MTDTVSPEEARSRNIEQMLNELRVTAYTDGYRQGYLEACRWNDVGTGSHDGPFSGEEVRDDLEDNGYPDEDDTEEAENFGVPPETEEPGHWDGGPF